MSCVGCEAYGSEAVKRPKRHEVALDGPKV